MIKVRYILALALALVLPFALIACNSDDAEEYVPAEPQEEIIVEEIESNEEEYFAQPEAAEFGELRSISLMEAVEIIESRGFEIGTGTLNISYEKGGVRSDTLLMNDELADLASYPSANEEIIQQMTYAYRSADGTLVSLRITGGQLVATWGAVDNGENVTYMILEDPVYVVYQPFFDSFNETDILSQYGERMRDFIVDRITPESLAEFL